MALHSLSNSTYTVSPFTDLPLEEIKYIFSNWFRNAKEKKRWQWYQKHLTTTCTMECNKNHTIIKQSKVVKNTIFFLVFFIACYYKVIVIIRFLRANFQFLSVKT